MKRIAVYGVIAAVLGIIIAIIPLTPLILKINSTLNSENYGTIDLLTRAMDAAESEGYFNGEASPLVTNGKSGSFESSLIRFLLVVFIGFISSITFFYLIKNRIVKSI